MRKTRSGVKQPNQHWGMGKFTAAVQAAADKRDKRPRLKNHLFYVPKKISPKVEK